MRHATGTQQPVHVQAAPSQERMPDSRLFVGSSSVLLPLLRLQLRANYLSSQQKDGMQGRRPHAQVLHLSCHQ